MHGGEARSLARQIESSQLMAAQGEGAVSPLHIGTRALEHGRQPLGLVMAVGLGLGAQRVQNATGCTQRGAQPLGKLAKRVASADAARLGHAIERGRGDELGVHGQGDRRWHIELSDLLSDLTRDALDGRLHFGHAPLGCVDVLQAALAESCVLGNGANRLDVPLDIGGDAWAIAASPALASDKGIVVTNAPETRLDLGTLRTETLGLAPGRVERVLSWLQAYGVLWGTPCPARRGLVTRALPGALGSRSSCSVAAVTA